MGRLRRVALVALLLALASSGSAAASTPSGMINAKTLDTSKTLASGVVVRHYTATVAGLPKQEIYEVVWPLGDTHIRLGATLLGSYTSFNQSIGIQQISPWYAAHRPTGLLAMLNGDFFTYSNTGAIVSGMLVKKRAIYHFAGGAPAAGLMPDGNMVIGHPQAMPTRVLLPTGSATVYGWNQVPPQTHTDQVGAYLTAGEVVSVPSGYRAVIIHNAPFRTLLHGSNTYTNPTGLNKAEAVSSFYLVPTGAATTRAAFTVSAPADPTSATVPANGAVLVMPSTGIANDGFTTVLAQPTPKVNITTSDPAWAAVTNVVGGKPQVVANGVAITQRDSFTTADQWSAQQWRPALATTTSGKGMMIVIGAANGQTSTTGPQFARMLAQLGAKDAIQFDNRSSTELFLAGTNNRHCVTAHGACYTQQAGWERDIPVAISLRYH